MCCILNWLPFTAIYIDFDHKYYYGRRSPKCLNLFSMPMAGFFDHRSNCSSQNNIPTSTHSPHTAISWLGIVESNETALYNVLCVNVIAAMFIGVQLPFQQVFTLSQPITKKDLKIGGYTKDLFFGGGGAVDNPLKLSPQLHTRLDFHFSLLHV